MTGIRRSATIGTGTAAGSLGAARLSRRHLLAASLAVLATGCRRPLPGTPASRGPGRPQAPPPPAPRSTPAGRPLVGGRVGLAEPLPPRRDHVPLGGALPIGRLRWRRELSRRTARGRGGRGQRLAVRAAGAGAWGQAPLAGHHRPRASGRAPRLADAARTGARRDLRDQPRAARPEGDAAQRPGAPRAEPPASAGGRRPA